LEGEHADRSDECSCHRSAPIGTAPFPPALRLRLEHLGDRRGFFLGVLGIELRHERIAIGVDRARDRPDVAAGVHGAARGVEVVVLHGADDAGPEPGDIADLLQRQATLFACRGQRFADAHTRLLPCD